MIRCVKNGECLADIALCVTGAVEGVWALSVRNGVSVTAELRNGMELAWLPDDVEDADVAARYRAEKIEPATDISARELALLLEVLEADETPTYGGVRADEVEAQVTRADVCSDEYTAAFA